MRLHILITSWYSWIKWWDSRKVFIFSAFAPKNAPKMNLAEVIHAGWSNRDSPNLSLLDAAQIDTKDSILLAAELKAIEKESSIAFGQGPSFQQKKARSHHQELARAVRLGERHCLLKWFPNRLQLPPPANAHHLQRKWNSATKGIRRRKMNKAPHKNHSHASKMPARSRNNHPPQHQRL